MRVDCVGVRVRWRMYGVGVCVDDTVTNTILS